MISYKSAGECCLSNQRFGPWIMYTHGPNVSRARAQWRCGYYCTPAAARCSWLYVTGSGSVVHMACNTLPTCIIHIHALGAREWAIGSRWPATNPANCMRKLAPCNCRASRHSGNPGLGVAFENYRAWALLRGGGWSTKSWRARKPLWTGTRLKPLIREIREWGERSAANINALVITSFCTAPINHVILKFIVV